jgi:starch phosphorylase
METANTTSPSTPAISPESLAELALDLRWSWNHSGDELWAQLEPELWTLTRNPWVVLQTASRIKLQEILARPDYRDRVETLLRLRSEYLNSTAWFQERHSGAPLTGVAYFSMEFGLSEALPIYAGGLGNVAGDQLKAASDHHRGRRPGGALFIQRSGAAPHPPGAG